MDLPGYMYGPHSDGLPMALSSVRRNLLVPAVALLCSCIAPDLETPWRWDLPIADQADTLISPLALVESSRIDLPGLMDFYGAFRLDGTGGLWTEDLDLCAVIRIQLTTGERTDSIGRCGEGPGEFRDIGPFELLGDTAIAVWDHSLDRLTILGRDGAVRYFRPHPLSTDTTVLSNVVNMAQMESGVLGITHGVQLGSEAPTVTLYDYQRDSILKRVLPQPSETWRTGEGDGSPAHIPLACSGMWGAEYVLAVSQAWASETAVLDSRGEVKWIVYDSLATGTRKPQDGRRIRTAQLVADHRVRAPICTPEGFFQRTAKFQVGVDGPVDFDRGGRIRYWDSAGSLRLDAEVSLGHKQMFDHGVWYDGMLWFEDRWGYVPAIVGFRLVPKADSMPAVVRSR